MSKEEKAKVKMLVKSAKYPELNFVVNFWKEAEINGAKCY
jgi:hypothetical protein